MMNPRGRSWPRSCSIYDSLGGLGFGGFLTTRNPQIVHLGRIEGPLRAPAHLLSLVEIAQGSPGPWSVGRCDCAGKGFRAQRSRRVWCGASWRFTDRLAVVYVCLQLALPHGQRLGWGFQSWAEKPIQIPNPPNPLIYQSSLKG